MRDTRETLTFLEHERQSGSTAWKAKCLMLARKARDIEAMFPSALAAQLATPMQHRITDPGKIRQGMIAFYDDPNDSNPFGHITSVAGRDQFKDRLEYTNDAFVVGGVSVVTDDFFEREWGDKFQFASDWLNGEELDLPERKPKPRKPLGKAKALRKGKEILEGSLEYHQRKGHTRLVKALKRDIRELHETINRFSKEQ